MVASSSVFIREIFLGKRRLMEFSYCKRFLMNCLRFLNGHLAVAVRVGKYGLSRFRFSSANCFAHDLMPAVFAKFISSLLLICVQRMTVSNITLESFMSIASSWIFFPGGKSIIFIFSPFLSSGHSSSSPSFKNGALRTFQKKAFAKSQKGTFLSFSLSIVSLRNFSAFSIHWLSVGRMRTWIHVVSSPVWWESASISVPMVSIFSSASFASKYS